MMTIKDGELTFLKNRRVNFKKQTFNLNTLDKLDSISCIKVEDNRITDPYTVMSVDMRPDKPPVGRSDVAHIIYRYDKAVYQLVGNSPIVRERAVLAVKKLEDDHLEESILEVLGFI